MFTDETRDKAAGHFMTEFGVSESTAGMLAFLYLTISESRPEAEAQQEFERVTRQALQQGESWATEFVQASFGKLLPEYRATYERALTTGRDPATELVRVHTLPAAEASEVVAHLVGEASINTTKPGAGQEQEAPTGRPYLADITCPDGVVTVTVDPAATVASATVRTKDTSGPSADAARNASISLNGDVLTVVVPKVKATVINNTHVRGGTVYQNVSYVGPGTTGTGVTIDGNGNMTIGGISGGGHNPVEVDVILPPGSGVQMDSYNAPLTVRGALAALDFKTQNGNLNAGVLGRVKVRGYNGDNVIDAVQEWADLETYNGNNEIDSYSGGEAKLVTYNGDIRLTASRTANGRIEARTYNGDIRLRGVSGRSDLAVSTKTRNGDVRKS
ncbi:DUF4097 family beta strand repeat-containing protein [Streptomyces sp. NBC_01549]|uniref:DUF4097 family beta strand repeat-containing protein n=1 Tax=Streptomyces sp. NBC_01549 TaxID=2975874 RepID=UPI002254E6A7|nr:DUF4097 family beta strand repeat-containing protein [Streptomyces sp. NBC_01549]MCX4598318.1 DUF4097 family beta strand repeat-containing protein [Streptomyces sp. NBC_01549]